MKEIQGYEGLYSVNKEGDVYSHISEIYLKQQTLSRTGYKYCSLHKNGKQIKFTIHRLVAETFLPNPDDLSQVNHRDGNKLNNRLDNLEWCTRSENMKHAWDSGLITFTEKMRKGLDEKRKLAAVVNRKLTFQDAQEIRNLRDNEGIGCRKLARKYNVSKGCIDNILSNKTYKYA